MKSHWLFYLVSVLFMFNSHPAFAQGEQIEDLMAFSLEDLMEFETAGRGEAGSFGYRLEETGAKITIHGYVTNEYINTEGTPGTFDNHYFNLFVTGNLTNRIIAEIQLEYEHGGSEIQARYAQVDFVVMPELIIRTGKFLIPAGVFNEFLYPEYISKTVQRPFVLREIVPTSWADVGVQIRGGFPSGDFQPTYAIYVVNGLEGAEGAGFRGMRGGDDGSFRDKKSNNKAVGGHLGLAVKGLELGVSHYSGTYTTDGMHDLTISGLDFGYIGSAGDMSYTLRGEYHMAEQDVTGGTKDKDGFYAQVSVIVAKRFEPVLQYDAIEEKTLNVTTKDNSRVTYGINIILSDTAKIKVNFEQVDVKNGTDFDTVGVQAAIGF